MLVALLLFTLPSERVIIKPALGKIEMFGTSAPYVVTAMISLISWILSTYYSETKSTPYLKYEVVLDEKRTDLRVVRYRFTNVSPVAQIEGLNVSLTCQDANPCLKSNGSDGAEFGKTYNVEPWSMKTALDESQIAISQDISLPPEMSFEIEGFFFLTAKDPKILITWNGSGRTNIKIVTRQGLDLFFARHYLLLSFLFWIFSMCVLVSAYITRTKPVSKEEKPMVVHLKLLRGR